MYCSNNTLCYNLSACAGKCLTDQYSVCVENRTVCQGFNFFSYYNTNRSVKLCGSNQVCYDNTTYTCVNGTTLYPVINTRLCGSICYNPLTANCTNGVIRCINSCNDTCHSNAQYSYNNTLICNNGESVCDITQYNNFSYGRFGLTCYNSSSSVCSNNTLCDAQYACAGQCLLNSNTVCVWNRKLCSGFYFWDHLYGYRIVNLCGPHEICYDTSTYAYANGTTVCPGIN